MCEDIPDSAGTQERLDALIAARGVPISLA